MIKLQQLNTRIEAATWADERRNVNTCCCDIELPTSYPILAIWCDEEFGDLSYMFMRHADVRNRLRELEGVRNGLLGAKYSCGFTEALESGNVNNPDVQNYLEKVSKCQWATKINHWPEGYDGHSCTCTTDCQNPCKGGCGCEACGAAYGDFLSSQGE